MFKIISEEVTRLNTDLASREIPLHDRQQLHHLLSTCQQPGTGPAWTLLKLRDAFTILKTNSLPVEANNVRQLIGQAVSWLAPIDKGKEIGSIQQQGPAGLDRATALLVQADLEGTRSDKLLSDLAKQISDDQTPLQSLLWPTKDLLLLVEKLSKVNFAQLDVSAIELTQLVRAATSAQEILFARNTLNGDVVRALEATPVESLAITWCEVQGEGVDVSALQNLHKFELTNSKFSGNINLSAPSLKEFTLKFCQDFAGQLTFPESHSLEKIVIEHCNCWAQGLVANFAELRSLTLRYCRQYPASASLDLSDATQLSTLNISLDSWKGNLKLPLKGALKEISLDGCRQVPSIEPADYSQHPHLNSISLVGCESQNTKFVFGANRELQDLNFQNCFAMTGEIDWGVKSVSGVKLNTKNCRSWKSQTVNQVDRRVPGS